MQIAPGQTSLSLAMLKTLGSQTAAPAVKASPAPAPAASAAESRSGLPGGDGAAAARNLPRGSFVDLRA